MQHLLTFFSYLVTRPYLVHPSQLFIAARFDLATVFITHSWTFREEDRAAVCNVHLLRPALPVTHQQKKLTVGPVDGAPELKASVIGCHYTVNTTY